MAYMTHPISDFYLPLPINQKARRNAEQLARQQLTPEKAKQVWFNALATWVMNEYLQMLGFATDLTTSDCWHPVVSLFADTADLEIIGIGRLECRPLQPSAQPSAEICPVPPEVWEDRIGYVVVQFDEYMEEALLLGFTPTATGDLALNQLQPPEALIDYLHALSLVPARTTLGPLREALIDHLHASSPVPVRATLGPLRQWLQGVVDAGWQSIESFINPTELSVAIGFRSLAESDRAEFEQPGVKRAKLIPLGVEMSVILTLELRPEISFTAVTRVDQRISIRIQVHPLQDQLYLPHQLQLLVLDESGATFLEAVARRVDNYIQLQFTGSPGEHFGIKVALNEHSITETFEI